MVSYLFSFFLAPASAELGSFCLITTLASQESSSAREGLLSEMHISEYPKKMYLEVRHQ